MAKTKCPKNWKPHCSCSTIALEPSDKCWIHGAPDWRFCPYCGKFRYDNICTSCGCRYGVTPKWKKMWNRIINKIDLVLEEGNLYKKGKKK